MAPSYTYQDSFPPQTGRVQYVPYFQPAPEAVPSNMMVDPSSIPMFHGAGPYGANYSYPYHSCCNHMPFHGHYGYSPSYPHFLPPQPSPWWGSYAVCPPLVPVHHVPPAPPAHAAGIPRYEYDKDATRPGNHHCCGCPNHVCSPGKGEQSIKVEEEEPSLEEKPSFGRDMLPVNSINFRYPIVWIPPEYVKNDEGRRPLESTSGGTAQDVRSPRRSSQEEPSWRSVLPIQLEDLGLRKPDEGGWRKGNQQLGDNRNQFPYPIIWMPHAKQEEVERDVSDSSPKSPKNLVGDDKIGASRVEGETGISTASKHGGEKNIPVKDAEFSAGNVHQEDARKRAADVSHKGVEDKGKASSGRKEPVSPKEKPKLPPVCLRVDPLPRRKKSNSVSRSPSPPGARENVSPRVKDDDGGNPPAEVANEKKFGEEKRKQVKVIEVKDSPTGKKDEEMVMQRQNEREEVGKGTRRHETVEVSREDIASDGKTKKNKETVARPLSGTEAATLIQAAYRGFEVRKWETKKKLQQMARIREEVAKIKKSIQELDSSHSASLDQEKSAKQRILIGESTMSLLLTLDTIQGLHPSLRDVRKSLARELVTLQEKLDLLPTRTSGEHIEKSGEYMHEDPAEDKNKQQPMSEKEDSQHSEAISEHNEGNPTVDAVESPEVQPLDAEASLSSPLEIESSGEVVDADYGSQVLAAGDMNCVDEEVKSNQLIEQVSELKKSWEEGNSENIKVESDEVSSDGTVKIDASMGYEDPVSHDQEKGIELPVEDKERDGSSVYESENPREEDNGGGVSPAALHEDGVSALSEEIAVFQEMNGKEEEHPQEEDGGELLPVASLQDEESALQSEVNTTLGLREDEMTDNTEALTQTEEEFDKQVDNGAGEEATDLEKEMEVKQGQCDAHGPERIDVQMVPQSPGVSEVPEEQVVVAVEDVPASEGVETLVDESKLGDSILGDEPESNEKLLEENEKLREMMQKLMEAGKEQLDVISSLTGRVRDLEKKLTKKRKTRSRRSKISAAARRMKPSANSIERASSDAEM